MMKHRHFDNPDFYKNSISGGNDRLHSSIHYMMGLFLPDYTAYWLFEVWGENYVPWEQDDYREVYGEE